MYDYAAARNCCILENEVRNGSGDIAILGELTTLY